MSNSSPPNDAAWEKIFNKYNVLKEIEENGSFIITSAQINKYRESRLMTKFDHKSNLPQLFTKNELSILPISRGSYIIARFQAYENLEEHDSEVYKASIPDYIQSIDAENIFSEASAINCAYASMILGDFLEEEKLLPTLNGRMSSDCFSYRINAVKNKKVYNINVENAQIEIDGGYEGIKSLAIIEAKNYIADDFIIRQLYYPYRLWVNRIVKKPKPIFMTYTNGVYQLNEYAFENINDYNSIHLVKQKKYSLEIEQIALDDIIRVMRNAIVVPEPNIAFPQADNFKRIINLCELIKDGEKTRDEITDNYAFDPRQTNYYTDAGRYLGLVEKRSIDSVPSYALTDEGVRIIKMKYKTRQLRLVELILNHRVFLDTLHLHIQDGIMPSIEKVTSIMKESGLYRIAATSTFERRAYTIIGWVNWILELQR
jgi:hypothetical protein